MLSMLLSKCMIKKYKDLGSLSNLLAKRKEDHLHDQDLKVIIRGVEGGTFL